MGSCGPQPRPDGGTASRALSLNVAAILLQAVTRRGRIRKASPPKSPMRKATLYILYLHFTGFRPFHVISFGSGPVGRHAARDDYHDLR